MVGTVLIVESDEISARELQGRVEALGYRVVGATHRPSEARIVASQSRPDVVLIDVANSPRGGMAVARDLMEGDAPQVIYLTRCQRCFPLGRDAPPPGCLIRPFGDEDLAAALRASVPPATDTGAIAEVLVRMAPAMVLAWRSDGRLQVVNDAAHAWLGVRPGDRMPLHAEFLLGLEPGDGRDFVALRADGSSFPAEVWVSTADHLKVAYIRDITELGALQERMVTAQRMQAASRLAASAAHDFNNLLLAVRLNAWLLREHVHESGQDLVEQIQRAVTHGASLTAQLLTLQRPRTAGTASTEVHTTIQEFAGLIEGLLGSSKLVLDLVPVPPVPLRRSEIEQVILNLASNAAEAMSDSGCFTIQVRWRQGRVRIVATDNGDGIPPGVVERIFDPFYTTRSMGSGLGLSTVRELVEGAGGRVEVDSTPGRGAAFRIWLPAADRAPDRFVEPVPSTSQAHGAVLLVMRAEPAREALASVLRSLGFEVQAATGPGHALLLAEDPARRFEVVVTDERLPGMAGRELVALLARGRTSVGSVTLCDGPIAPGEVGMLRKPFTPVEIVAAIEAARPRSVTPPASDRRSPGGSQGS